MIEFDSDIRNQYIQNCRIFNSKCGDKGNSKCYVDFSKLPATATRPPICDPRTNFDFYETEYWHNILLLIGIGILFRSIGLAAVYRFIREPKGIKYPVPEAVKKDIDGRKGLELDEGGGLWDGRLDDDREKLIHQSRNQVTGHQQPAASALDPSHVNSEVFEKHHDLSAHPVSHPFSKGVHESSRNSPSLGQTPNQ